MPLTCHCRSQVSTVPTFREEHLEGIDRGIDPVLSTGRSYQLQRQRKVEDIGD